MERYRIWSSRLVIEAGTKLLIAASAQIWKTLNILLLFLLVWSTADLFEIESAGDGNTKLQAAAFFFGVLWSLPVRSLCDAD